VYDAIGTVLRHVWGFQLSRAARLNAIAAIVALALLRAIAVRISAKRRSALTWTW
jgi:hypothetical protein